MKTIYLFILALVFSSAHSQSTLHTFYFENDKYTLTQEHQVLLNGIAEQCKSPQLISVSITGYADTSGSEKHNEKLSQQRAHSVYDYLATKSGIDVSKITVTWLGEKNATTRTHESDIHAQQRCVDVMVTLKQEVKDIPIAELFNQLSAPSQRFCINPNRDTMLEGANGTLIRIAANSFNIPSDCSSECVEIRLKEAYDFPSMMLNNLHTTSNKNLLSTRGMIKLEAFSCNNVLQPLDGNSIAVMFPSADCVESMKLFYGERTRNSFDWKQSAGLVSCVSYSDIRNSLLGGQPDYAEECHLFFCKIFRLFNPNYKSYKGTGDASLDQMIGKQNVDALMKKYGVKDMTELRVALTNEYLKKVSKRGISNNQEWNFYLANVTQMGWVNCDFFPPVPPEQLTAFKVEIDRENNADVKLIFTGKRGIMNGDGEGSSFTFNSIPSGERAVIVAVQYRGDKIFFAKKETTITKNQNEKLVLKEISLEELKNQIQYLSS